MKDQVLPLSTIMGELYNRENTCETGVVPSCVPNTSYFIIPRSQPSQSLEDKSQ